MKIVDFSAAHTCEAMKLALMNYEEERIFVKQLPKVDSVPDLSKFVDNGLGVAAFDDTRMLGFLCCHKPWDNAFNSPVRGTFSPIHAHGAVTQNRGKIYKMLYQAAAEKWVRSGVLSHSIGCYAHDKALIDALFSYGFGLRCVDAIRGMDEIDVNGRDEGAGIEFFELCKESIAEIRDLRRMLVEHLGASPSFMYSPPEVFEKWLLRAEERSSRVFAAAKDSKLIAFVEVMNDGENFATEAEDMLNICGAFCLPQYRGMGVFQSLLNNAIVTLKAEGYARLGVDYESFNPTAAGFWAKHFTAYTSGLVRRIDSSVLLRK